MISLLCPTRGRPDNVDRMLHSVFSLAKYPVEVVFYIDDDDRSYDGYAFPVQAPHTTTVVRGPRIVLSETWNRCAEAARYDILGMSDDDVVYRTRRWDLLVKSAFGLYSDHVVMVHGRDGIHDARFGTHPFIHRRWMETTGYFVPPYFDGDYADAWLNDVANALGRRHYLPDLYTEHMHPVAGKAQWDATYRERHAREAKARVGELYESLAPNRQADVDKLRAVISVPA